MMKDFPIDSRGEIGKKRVRVPSMMIAKMEESMLREAIRKIAIKNPGLTSSIPSLQTLGGTKYLANR